MREEICSLLLSRPSRGAWIEMVWYTERGIFYWSRPSRGAWIEIKYCPLYFPRGKMSRPSRGAWIEILRGREYPPRSSVAPLAGRVD